MPSDLLRPIVSCQVAVIGAGASGLVVARELRREGHTVVVFERGDQIGGVWVYTPEVESDPLGLDPHRVIIHCSLYDPLRTNISRELMDFRNYPFVVKEDDKERDPRRFPGHREVLMYLQDFAREFRIDELVRLESEVVYVGMVEGGKWKVKSRRRYGGILKEYFDAVVVCVGHYWEPLIAQIPGIDLWPGKQMRSHNYRVPELFREKVVLLIGCSATVIDISQELAGVAKEVLLACRSVGILKLPSHDNVQCHPIVKVPTFWYKYHFPFLDTNGIVSVHDNRVGPLYKHVFPPELAPWLSFVGLQLKGSPFRTYELQSKWIAGALCNRISLPSPEEMMEVVKALYSSLEASGKPQRYTHDIGH